MYIYGIKSSREFLNSTKLYNNAIINHLGPVDEFQWRDIIIINIMI